MTTQSAEPPRRVTMAQVARRAGVHVTTVSLALRNHPSLPVATRERLQAVANKMGYRPDPALASLVAYRSQLRPAKTRLTLAYVTHWLSRWAWKKLPAHAQFFAGAEARASALGFDLEHFWLGEEGLRHERLSDVLVARGITGVIVASHHSSGGDYLRFDWERFSAVKIDYFPHAPALHSVTNHQCAVIQLAMRRTIAAGYRRIGFVMPHVWDDFVDHAWSAGFLAEQQHLTPEERIPILFYSQPGSDPLVPRAALEDWYRKFRPEVIVSYAPFVRERLGELGLAVPGDVAYVEIFLQDFDGRIAGVRQNCRHVGELAVDLLVGQLHLHRRGVPEFATTTLVEGTWFDGATLPPRRQPSQRPAPLAPDARRKKTAGPTKPAAAGSRSIASVRLPRPSAK